MWLVLPLLLLVSVWAQETSVEPQPGMVIAQRLAETLPRLPNVISGQMEGKPEELRSMISHMLGDGLISQLVTNPLGVSPWNYNLILIRNEFFRWLKEWVFSSATLGLTKLMLRKRCCWEAEIPVPFRYFHCEFFVLLSII
ncbi:unnamed protein product [Cylicostephanus goldi]|uniref:Uncharacterized protein n=1 Tax=Cylicostephanus goldi TaxID=71465 RepID=A0A3P6UXC8_CYLGO|nr:unnamed protein product [Cylicostephanus goldi]